MFRPPAVVEVKPQPSSIDLSSLSAGELMEMIFRHPNVDYFDQWSYVGRIKVVFKSPDGSTVEIEEDMKKDKSNLKPALLNVCKRMEAHWV